MNNDSPFEKSAQYGSSEERKEMSPMPCTEWAEKVNVAFPGCLSSAERMAFERHAVSCEACALVHTDYESMHVLLQTFLIPEPPIGLPSRLLRLWEDESRADKKMAVHETLVSQYATTSVVYREQGWGEEMGGIDNEIDQKTVISMNFFKPIRAQDKRVHREHDLLAS